MNIDEAIQILESPTDFVDAKQRAQAQQLLTDSADAQRTWERCQQADFAIRGAFSNIAIPADLKAACLAAYDAAMADETATIPAQSTPFVRPWMYAAAAAIAIFLLVQVPFRDTFTGSQVRSGSTTNISNAGVSSLLNDLGRQFGSFGSYHHRPDAVSGAASYFAEQGAPVNDFLIQNFSGVIPDGCRIVEVQGYRISMVCLHTEPFMHLFVAPREAAGDAVIAKPIQSKLHDVSFLAWTDGDHLLILATRAGNCDDLKRNTTLAFAK
jgi:hypothetical protein